LVVVSDVMVRPARHDDAPVLADLHLQVWDEAYAGLIDSALLRARRERPRPVREGMWRERLAACPTWVAESDGQIVGWVQAGAGRDPDEPGLELMSLYVISAVYGTGIGRRLMFEAIADRPAYLWVLEGNERAIRFYERHGFRFDGKAKPDPPYGTDLCMRRPWREPGL
jgi:ribosomal protein S18 acetylase RimI-like enzyme